MPGRGWGDVGFRQCHTVVLYFMTQTARTTTATKGASKLLTLTLFGPHILFNLMISLNKLPSYKFHFFFLILTRMAKCAWECVCGL